PRPDIEPEVLRYAPVVDEAISPGGLLVAGDERDAANLDALRRGEKRHLERVALDGGHDGAAVEHDTSEAGLGGRDRGRQATRPSPDYDELGRFAPTSMI